MPSSSLGPSVSLTPLTSPSSNASTSKIVRQSLINISEGINVPPLPLPSATSKMSHQMPLKDVNKNRTIDNLFRQQVKKL